MKEREREREREREIVPENIEIGSCDIEEQFREMFKFYVRVREGETEKRDQK